MADIESLKRDLVTACRILHREGLVRAFGHISARIPGTDRLLIPPRMGPGLVRAEDVLTMDLSGKVLEGKREPNSEAAIHWSIYRARPDAMSVAHTHSPMTVVIGDLGLEVQPLHNEGTVFGEGVPRLDATGLIQTEEQGKALVAALGRSNAVLLRAHGDVVVGSGVREACILALYLEDACRLMYQCLQVGKPVFLTPEESARIRPKTFNEKTVARAWEYFSEIAVR